MGGVVVGNQMQRFSLGRLTIDLFQKSQPLGVSVMLLTLANTLRAANSVVVLAADVLLCREVADVGRARQGLNGQLDALV